MNTQAFTFTKQFTDHAFKAQAAVLESIEQATGLQLKALEQHAAANAAFAAEALDTRDFDGLRKLWDKGASLNREHAERAVGVGQDLYGIAQHTAETLGNLGREQQQAATQAAAKAGKKAAR